MLTRTNEPPAGYWAVDIPSRKFNELNRYSSDLFLEDVQYCEKDPSTMWFYCKRETDATIAAAFAVIA
jgi:hypothetical protein